ncbi:MAG: type II toxin-antitoxin system VapC family toxin [Proteobacteria bacterium]|nr:type II toxin-antitoxin system VapC family toxin [Pseudomonadota bacterium]MBU0988938.1 type II toxin-antitoxin system VapC family toxin [Pseudomonadota bacterium]MBU1902664.1 type II toxin-antitoxin system VapC family toxin [Pseudomonadota bacterium]
MNLFLDTSALVKFFHEEEGTEAVTDLILDLNNEIWILELARLEFLSAVFRRFRNKELNEERLNTAIDSFENQVARFNIEPLGRAVLEEAGLLMKDHGRTHGLKALDALHLGAFSLISEEDWAFVAADDSLCGVAELSGYNTINPLKGNA